ncbi:ECF transporter S component [Thermosediminibacter oceani]|uniref:Alpha-ribazole transporter n=1 Tax=Thermosediminibacter oceani (strain ATCC BAA-1034 / DSM 16646 / JW/IW-1228P) TaxID=555079 RepID=D9RZU9_THEOJ|nr:ECF transporter S component [Thermosediminibacter oceani]ADL08726.1 conserved hypothetical protein [Thermosediminibacter oceani DSM 16646]
MINQKTKNLTLTAMFIALSFVGAAIKVPSPTGTVAFDSAPGYMAALFLGPGYGAMTAALGHIFTSMNVGFPLSMPIHLLVAAEMAFFAWVFGLVGQKNLILAVVVAWLMNGILAPASLIPFLGTGFFAAMVLYLIVVSALNVAASAVLYSIIRRSKGEYNAL